MAENIVNPFTFTCNIKEFIIDEIALEGLEGIGLKLLWKRLEARISAPITEKMKLRLWDFIANCKSISFYELPKPLPDIEIIDRLTLIDDESGYLKDPDDYLDGPYQYAPVDHAYGSSVYYRRRVLVSNNIDLLTYENVVSEYGDKLALVASAEERWKALAPDLPLYFQAQIFPLNYCLLELIGKSRGNGQMTTGKTNMSKIVKDSKLLFYHRKTLQDLDLVRVTSVSQVTSGRAVKSLLIRLKRFHKSDILSVPKSGLIHNLVDYLKNQPNFCEKTDVVMKKGLMTQAQNKKFQKKVSIFHFEETQVSADQISASSPKETPRDTENPKKISRKRYMYLVSKSDESSQSDDDEVTQPLKCQYKVGVNLLRQAYERFLEAGRNGLTQYELAQLVGVEFYICRTICRIFKSKNIIREFIECKGRQRLGRYIAIVATSKMDSKLAEEKEKFQKLLDEGNNLCKKGKRTLSEVSSDSESLNVKKKRKMEKEDANTAESGITEVQVIDGVKKPERKLNLKSKVSLRQLRFANGILKVLHEKTFVLGYQALSNLVAQDTSESPMDTKAMKLLLQGMVSAGNLKIYKMKVPRSSFPYTVVICAPHIKPNNESLRAKYKDLIHKVTLSQRIAERKTKINKPLSQYAYPRYVKVQKLHEALVKIMYFDDVKPEPYDLPPGFFTIGELIPELTVAVALGHISSEGVIDVSKFTIDDSLLDVKIRNAPPDLHRTLIKSKNLQSSLRSILKILAQFGLVQLIVQSVGDIAEPNDNSMAINLFYVNKCAKIIDTTGVWPRKDAPIESLERRFNFDSMDVVQDYWHSVYHISINTTVNVPNRRQKHVQIKPPVRTINQVVEFDIGLRFGNGLGPCGFDSIYYLDIQRLWKAYCIRSNSLKSKLKKGTVKIPKFDIPRKKRVQKKKKITVKKSISVKKPEVVNVVHTVKQGEKTKKRVIPAKVWTPEEDRILMMCKTAITIMSPISQPGCLRVRNLVSKDILSLRDPKKTQGVCHKRAAFIEINSTLTHEKNCIMNELRRLNLLRKYEGLLKKLRILYSTNMTRYMNEARIPMMELVWIIYQISKNIATFKDTPCNPLSLEDFNKKFTITPSSANQPFSLYKTPHDEIRIATLKEAILLTVMLSFGKVIDKETADIIYSYFHKFPENVLRTAVEPLRKCGAIVAKDKLIRLQLHIVDLDDIVQCSYRISAGYQRKWISRLNAEFADNMIECFNGDMNRDAVKASPETNCFCFEMQANGLLDIVAVTVPVIAGSSGSIIQEEQLNVIDIATNYKLKSGTFGWKNKSDLTSYLDLYKYQNFHEALDDLSSRSFISEEIVEKNIEYLDDNLVAHLMTKREKGATFIELQETLNYGRKQLIEILSDLQSKNIVKRVGFYENVIVLMKYVKNWCMSISGGYIVPEPWLTLDSKVRPEIFFKWAGVVMNKIFECPGSSLTYLADSSEFLSVRAVQDICEMLQKCNCVTLHTLFYREPSLFSDNDDMPTVFDDYNEFESPENIVVVPEKDSLSKYSYVKSVMSVRSTNSCEIEDSQ